MQISKTLLTLGAAALCLTAVSSRAVDTEADLKLREALRQKMAEMGPENPAPTVAPAPSKPAKVKTPKTKQAEPVAPAAPAVAAPVVPAPVAGPAPVAAPVAPPVAPVVAAPVVVQPAPQPTPTAADEAQLERLREALRARMQQEAPAPVTPAPTQPQQVVTQGSDLEPTVSTTKVVAPAAPVQVEAPAPAPAPVVTKVKKPSKKPKAPVQAETPAPAEVNAPIQTPVVLETPASPIPVSKEQRLVNLLQQYKADQISPQEYHEQRAKILAE